MNKKLAYALCVGAVASLTLAGCGGKSEKEEFSEYYQKELDLEEEDADELAEIAEEIYEEEAAEEQAEAEQAAEAQSAFKLYDATSEIKNSKLTDEIVQVGGVVLRDDGSMTLGEVMEMLQEDGTAILKDDKHREITEASLVEPEDKGTYYLEDEFENDICEIEYINETEEIAGAYECKVIDISTSGWPADDLDALNFFYAGDICTGVYRLNGKNAAESAEYAKRLEEYPLMTYQEVEDTLKQKGAENISFDDQNERYEVYIYSDQPIYTMNDKEYYKVRGYMINIDMTTATVSSIIKTAYYGDKDLAFSSDNNISLDCCITPEVAEELEEVCSATLGAWNMMDATATTEGYFIGDQEKYYTVLCTDRGTHVVFSFNMERAYDGSYHRASGGDYPSEPYESFDEAAADYGAEPDSIIRLNE